MENKPGKFHVFTGFHYPRIILNNNKLGGFVGDKCGYEKGYKVL